jgi:pseudouridine kinase
MAVDLIVVGGAHVDRLARLVAPHVAATSNPATLRECAGGGAFNAARAVRRFGASVALVSARGADAGAALVESAISEAGIRDLAAVHLDRATPSYTAILAPGGELVTAIADMGLHETAIAKALRRSPVIKAFSMASAVLIDANIGMTAIEAAVEMAAGKPVYALAISAGKVARFAGVIARLDTLFLNRHESATLTGLPATDSAATHALALSALGLQRAVVSAGAEPLAILEHGTVSLLQPPPARVVDVTGAGDALAGTSVALLMRGAAFDVSVRHGVAAAGLTIEQHGPVPRLDAAAINRRARRIDAAVSISQQLQ